MRVALLNMPFSAWACPNFGISILKPGVEHAGFPCSVKYFNFQLAALNRRNHDRLPTNSAVGEWIFSPFIRDGFTLDFGALENTAMPFYAKREPVLRDVISVIKGLYCHIEEFFEGCLKSPDVRDADVVGFSLMFYQTLASAALARLVKERWPGKAIIFGGAACQGKAAPALHRSFPWVDYVLRGEADHTLPELLSRISKGTRVDDIPGIVWREHGGTFAGPKAEPVRDLDALPVPDFGDFWSQAPRCTPAFLMFEGSRGCWWGEKHQCVFCGLNGQTLEYREKSPGRLLNELAVQAEKYPGKLFMGTDCIMPHDYTESFFPRLAEEADNIRTVWETKANLKPWELRLMKDAGVSLIQPGVESLSTSVLRLMRKGVTAIQVVQTLKWCRDLGIKVMWNILCGFAGETAENYAETERTASAITHLGAPLEAGPFFIARDSPAFNDPGRFGYENIRLDELMKFVYAAIPECELGEIVRGFQGDLKEGRPADAFIAGTRAVVGEWKKCGGDLRMVYGSSPEMLILDTRLGKPVESHEMSGWRRRIYEQCAEIRLVRDIESSWGTEGAEFIDEMVQKRLMIREGGQVLSLALHSGAWV